MSSDSDAGGPSPLPSPIFARCSPARSTVARKCREYFLQRLERTANMQKRWSICSSPHQDFRDSGKESVPFGDKGAEDSDKDTLSSDTDPGTAPNEVDDVENSEIIGTYPLRKCNSNFDIAMDSLRKEISSLIAQDNNLFRQLLSLHDSIAELRERQRRHMCDSEDEEESDCEFAPSSPGLDSLSPHTSPESTLSSRSSSLSATASYKASVTKSKCGCKSYRSRLHRKSEGGKKRSRTVNSGSDESRPLVFIDKSEICFRCRKMAPPYRRSSSITSLYYLHEDLESYDSGIHLQGSHSDSDHEIFV